MYNQPFHGLLKKTGWALVICTLLVSICYHNVDKQVAYFIYNHKINKIEIFQWLTQIPPVILMLTPIILVFMLVKLAWRPWYRFEKMLFVMVINLYVSIIIKNALKYSFGRLWPLTWKNNNPALIPGAHYGFHPFHGGIGYRSFPSGDTTMIFSIMVVLWLTYPKWRWLSGILCAAVMIGLIGMDYHFVGDVVAGAFVGSITAVYATYLSGLKKDDLLAEQGK